MVEHRNVRVRRENLFMIARVVAFEPMTAVEIAMVTGLHKQSVARILRLDRRTMGIGIVRRVLRVRKRVLMYGITDQPDVPPVGGWTNAERQASYLERLKTDPDLRERRKLTFAKYKARRRVVVVRDPLLKAFFGK